jgi:hypothetical protein
MGNANSDLFVWAQDRLGHAIAAVIDERIMKTTIRRPRVEGDVLDAEGL